MAIWNGLLFNDDRACFRPLGIECHIRSKIINLAIGIGSASTFSHCVPAVESIAGTFIGICCQSCWNRSSLWVHCAARSAIRHKGHGEGLWNEGSRHGLITVHCDGRWVDISAQIPAPGVKEPAAFRNSGECDHCAVVISSKIGRFRHYRAISDEVNRQIVGDRRKVRCDGDIRIHSHRGVSSIRIRYRIAKRFIRGPMAEGVTSCRDRQ